MSTITTSSHEAAPKWKRYTPGHHWRNAEDEFNGAKFGMWLFLSTEILLFSGMFCAYVIMRMLHPEAFAGASEHYLDWQIGAFNTVVLLISSFTVVMAVRAAQLNKQGQLKFHLIVSALLGLLFLGIKLGFEYWPKIQMGKLPGELFTYPNGHNDYDPVFLSIYWVATGIHGFHVLVGAGLLLWVFLRAGKGHFGPKHYTTVENVGLYWHLVDLIWIFLFPLMYLAP